MCNVPSKSKILMNIIKNHPLRFSIVASASVPWIYMAQFCHTLKEDGSKNRLKFLLDRKELKLTLDDFRTIFHLPQAKDNNHASFVQPSSFSNMPWQALCKIFSKCLTTRVTRWDQPPLQIMQMLYCFVNNIHVDYAELMWEVEETRISPIPSPTRSPRNLSTLVSSDTEKLQELTVTHPTPSSGSFEPKLTKNNRLLSMIKAKPNRFKRYKSFFHELQGRYGYLFAHLKKRFMPRTSSDQLADNLHDVMMETLPSLVREKVTEQVKKEVPVQVRNQVPVYLAKGLIMERKTTTEETERLISKAILKERGHMQEQISSQIQNAIDNAIPSLVDASVRGYMSGHILYVHPAQVQSSSVPEQQHQLYLAMKADPLLQQQDIAIWLALRMKFKKSQTDSYAFDDDEIPTKQVTQDIMEEISLTIDEFKAVQRDPEVSALSLITLLYLRKEIQVLKDHLSHHKFQQLTLNDDDNEELTSNGSSTKEHKEPEDQRKIYSNSKIVLVQQEYWNWGHEHNLITEIHHENKYLIKLIQECYASISCLSGVLVTWERVHDFQLDFEPDPRVPLIIRRCFLKTGRALIDLYKGELTLRVGNEAITYNLDQTLRYSVNYNDMTANRIDIVELACEDYSQEVLGFLDVIASGNPTPGYDPIVLNSSPILTPFGDSDFLLLEEADAFLTLADDPTSLEVDESYYDLEGDILILEALLNSDHSPPPNQGNYLPENRKELKICEAKTAKSSIEEPPEVELKDLPPHLEYAITWKDNTSLPIHNCQRFECR
ncbi:hypothetical protein Tco_1368176 [Tanacetum coccineum]